MDIIFTLDIGSTTQDFLLLADKNLRNCPKAILPSPTRIIAKKIEKLNEDVFLYGYTMGGGAITRAVKRHIEKGFRVFATQRAALTFSDNLDEVKEMGVILADDVQAFKIKTADVDVEFFSTLIDKLGYEQPELYAIAVQDHGFSPIESNRVFRFKMFRKLIDERRFLEGLIFSEKELAKEFNRMRDAIHSITDSKTGNVYVTDTSFAAISGLAAFSTLPALLINFGNSHTTAALVDRDLEIKALVEHHTNILQTKGKEYTKWFFEEFVKGKIDNEYVLNEMGHGCYVRELIDIKKIVATGPKAWLADYEEPKGDPMIFGNLGMIFMLSKRGVIDYKFSKF
ncbi:MAG: DUF1786 family protein [Archaeoglobaceae archaeon]